MNGTWGELEVESGSLLKVRALHGPTKTLRTPLRRGLQWKLISHLSLNHLSIVEGGLEALRELLKLYNFSESPAVARQISGLCGVRSRRKMARVNSDHGFVFCQGIHVDVEFDEEEYAGSGAFLLACVLERFFGLYCALNSFSQLSVSTRQRKGVAWVWPPRTGEQIVL
jgi:type VI secretion system protein ImpG